MSERDVAAIEWIRRRDRALVAIRDLQRLIASHGRERPLAATLRYAEIAIYFSEAVRRRERKQHR